MKRQMGTLYVAPVGTVMDVWVDMAREQWIEMTDAWYPS